MNYTELSEEELLKLGEERNIVINDDPSCTDYAFSKGKRIDKFNYDDFSLFHALKLVHYRKLAEGTEEPALKHLREIRVSLIGTCWEEVYAHWRFGLQRKVPGDVSEFIRWNIADFVRLLQSCNFPFRGDRNLSFRYEVNQYTCNFQFFLDLEWEDEFGEITLDREHKEKLTPEVFLKDQEVLRECLEKFQAMEEIVLQGVEVPVEPTENALETFEVVDKLFAIDPCYQRSYTKDARMAGVLDAQAGTWRATACNGTESGWGYRCRNLLVVLEGFEIDRSKWEQSDCCVSVDSGQAGFYCASIYPEEREESEFYDQACESHGEFKAGIHPNGKGVTSSTGFGDGGYSLYYIKNSDGKVCAARIVYIDEEGESTDPGMIMFGYIFGRFAQLAQLEDGWAGEGSKAPTDETLKLAQQFALNGFGPSFIFPQKNGHIALYRVKWEDGKWTRYVRAQIYSGHAKKDGFTLHIKRGQRGTYNLQDVIQRSQFPMKTILKFDRMREWVVKYSWEFTDPMPGGSKLEHWHKVLNDCIRELVPRNQINPIFRRFAQLDQLEDGWAGEGSKAPSAETLKFAQQFALNGFRPSFIFANSEGHITMYRIKRENGKWTRFVKTVITWDSGSGDYGLCIFRKRVQGGYVDMWGMNDKESQERAIKKSWEFTDPKESSPDLTS